ncbi:MAG: hypothetical protein HZA46_13505 [Planctomycetales bacterium]|nr:hypothetical protein [Planctomycetales bacterium]
MSQTTTNPDPSADFSATLKQAETELAALKSKLRTSSRITSVVATLVLIVLSGYFYFGYTEISAALQPKELADATAAYIDSQLPEVRQQMEGQVKENAAEWVKLASEHSFEAIPEMRLALENFVIEHMNELFDQVATLTEDEFRTFLKDHREIVEVSFKDLADNPTVSDEHLAQLVQALEEELGVEMKTQAEDLLALLDKLADEVERLKEGKNLGDLEKKKLRILMIARRLQTDQGLQKDEDDLEMLKPLQDAVKGAVEKDAG